MLVCRLRDNAKHTSDWVLITLSCAQRNAIYIKRYVVWVRWRYGNFGGGGVAAAAQRDRDFGARPVRAT